MRPLKARRPVGRKQQEGRRLFPLTLMIAAIALLGGAVVFHYGFRGNTGLHEEQVAAAEIILSQRISGASLHFSSAAETNVTRLSESDYRVTGFVDLVAPDGRSSHHTFSCDIRKREGGDWIADEINLIPPL